MQANKKKTTQTARLLTMKMMSSIRIAARRHTLKCWSRRAQATKDAAASTWMCRSAHLNCSSAATQPSSSCNPMLPSVCFMRIAK